MHIPEHVQRTLLEQAGFSLTHRDAHPWLIPLLAAHRYLHASLALDIAETGRIPACGPNCSHCCKQPIPVTPVEILALRLYISLYPNPARKKPDNPFSCPFLIGGTCSVYPVRPIACRRFIVFGVPCAPREAPTESRPGDVLWPSRDALLHTLRFTLPFYESLGIAPNGPAGMDFFAAHTTFAQHEDWGFPGFQETTS